MNTATTTLSVTVYGPNLGHRAGGPAFHVHRTGCADTKRGIYARLGADQGGWDTTVGSIHDIVGAIYSDIIAENDDYQGDGWESLIDDVRIFPCVELPHDVEPAEVTMSEPLAERVAKTVAAFDGFDAWCADNGEAVTVNLDGYEVVLGAVDDEQQAPAPHPLAGAESTCRAADVLAGETIRIPLGETVYEMQVERAVRLPGELIVLLGDVEAVGTLTDDEAGITGAGAATHEAIKVRDYRLCYVMGRWAK